VGGARVGAAQPGPIEPGAAQVGPLQLGAPQPGFAQIGLHQVGILQLAAFTPALLQGAHQGQGLVGTGATSRGVPVSAQANGSFALSGDAQVRTGVLRGVTNDTTETELSLDGLSPTNATTFVLPANATFAFEVQIVARRADAPGPSSAYTLHGCIARDATVSTTTLVNSNKIITGTPSLGWDVRAVADTTHGRLAIFVTGENGMTIRWVAAVKTIEVTS